MSRARWNSLLSERVSSRLSCEHVSSVEWRLWWCNSGLYEMHEPKKAQVVSYLNHSVDFGLVLTLQLLSLGAHLFQQILPVFM